METKGLIQSKTFWINLALGLAGMLGPKYSEHINTETVSAALAIANIALRLISKGKVTLK